MRKYTIQIWFEEKVVICFLLQICTEIVRHECKNQDKEICQVCQYNPASKRHRQRNSYLIAEKQLARNSSSVHNIFQLQDVLNKKCKSEPVEKCHDVTTKVTKTLCIVMPRNINLGVPAFLKLWRLKLFWRCPKGSPCLCVTSVPPVLRFCLHNLIKIFKIR